MEIIFIVAGIAFIIGVVTGYRLCLYRHRPRTSKANRRWQKWRDKQITCVACTEVATMGCKGQGEATTWWCRYHFLGVHQPVQGIKGQWVCEHPDQVATSVKR